MTSPLSVEFNVEGRQATGMYGGPRGRVSPRGSYTVPGVGDPAKGYSGYGYFWGPYTQLTSGTSDIAGLSTETGSPVGTPSPVAYDMLKVGGGPTQADNFTEEPASNTQGMSQGGTAAY
jgi:hypothetical protein